MKDDIRTFMSIRKTLNNHFNQLMERRHHETSTRRQGQSGDGTGDSRREGYHLQEVNLLPADEAFTSGQMVGQGVEYAGVRRLIDQVLEGEMLRHESTLAELDRQLETLKSMESAFGELSTAGLSTSIDEFFGAFQDL